MTTGCTDCPPDSANGRSFPRSMCSRSGRMSSTRSGIGARWSPPSCIRNAAAVRCGFACCGSSSPTRNPAPICGSRPERRSRRISKATKQPRAAPIAYPDEHVDHVVNETRFRRSFLRGAAAASALSLPGLLRAQSQTTLRYVPVIDLTFVDPIYSTAQVSRNHGFMVYDTLYGMNSALDVSPQMVSGHVVSNDERQWDLTLRDGLLWHDGERVLARDCVASIRRWAARDGYGAELMAATDELSAPDDRTIRFRLSRPFPLLPLALGKSAIQAPFMMPERLASQDAFKPLTEAIGSGPFRFVADERVQGARNVYARFDRYQPRQDGKPDWTAGPKIVHYDRVVWTTMPDAATGVAALQK